MSPVTIPATTVQQLAETLTGIALAQLIPPWLPGDLRVVPVRHRHAVRLAAFGAHREAGRGGHFLAEHTMERFRDCFYRPLLSSTSNYERWVRQGASDTAARAGGICAKTLDGYQPPPRDDAVRAELGDFVARRRAELAD